jgi:hypothetical protein
MAGRIEWREGQYGSHEGWVNGKLRLVNINYAVSRSDPNWNVKTTLPIRVPAGQAGSNDLDEAKRMAETLVARFLKTIGARWV